MIWLLECTDAPERPLPARICTLLLYSMKADGEAHANPYGMTLPCTCFRAQNLDGVF
jgi:hypothetical protein